jgi:hypothetical protein
MTDTPFDPDPDVIAERRPTHCPFCGHDGAFDGQGKAYDTVTIKKDGQATVYRKEWYQVRCVECNGQFRMLDQAIELEEA